MVRHKHSIYDDDSHFIIDPDTRLITADGEIKKLVKGDHNSERFTFEIPRVVDGHDMSLCDKIEIHYINIGSNKEYRIEDVYEVPDKQNSPTSDDVMIFSWLVSGNATKYAGTLNFVIRFVCLDGIEAVYAWHTEICKNIQICNSFNNGESVVSTFPDVLEAWRLEIESTFTRESIVTPEMFGAVGDGVTDDTTAFETMLASAKSITIPAKTYKITRRLFVKQNTSIVGSGASSVILCNTLTHNQDDLFMVSANVTISNLRIRVTYVKGAIFKINETSLRDMSLGDTALGICIDHIMIDVIGAVDRQTSCFELSLSNWYGPSNNRQGYYNVNISNIRVNSNPSNLLGYFFKSFCKLDCWITGINVSDCTIYGARWGFFLGESDENIFDPSVTSSVDKLTVTNVQMQKNGTNCKHFIFVPKNCRVTLQNCTPWDWSSYGSADTHAPYLVDSWMLTHPQYTVGGLNVRGLSAENSVTDFAGIDRNGDVYRLDYYDFGKLYNIGTDFRPYRLMPKIWGMAKRNAEGKDPVAMLLYSGAVVKDGYTKIYFQLYGDSVPCNILIERNGDGSVTQKMDYDTCRGIRFSYSVSDDGTTMKLYAILSESSRHYHSMFRSIELANSSISYDGDSGGFYTYNKTISCDVPDEERYIYDSAEISNLTRISGANIKVNAYYPVLTASDGTRYKLVVDTVTDSTATIKGTKYSQSWATSQ